MAFARYWHLGRVTWWPPVHAKAPARDGRTVAHESGRSRARRSYVIWVTRRSVTVGRRGPRGRSLDVLAARTWGTEAVVTCQPGRADWLAAVAFLRPCAASGRAQPATLTPTPTSRPPFLPPSCPSLLCWRCLSSDVAFFPARVCQLPFV